MTLAGMALSEFEKENLGSIQFNVKIIRMTFAIEICMNQALGWALGRNKTSGGLQMEISQIQ